jgi:hypothetical protein
LETGRKASGSRFPKRGDTLRPSRIAVYVTAALWLVMGLLLALAAIAAAAVGAGSPLEIVLLFPFVVAIAVVAKENWMVLLVSLVLAALCLLLAIAAFLSVQEVERPTYAALGLLTIGLIASSSLALGRLPRRA